MCVGIVQCVVAQVTNVRDCVFLDEPNTKWVYWGYWMALFSNTFGIGARRCYTGIVL